MTYDPTRELLADWAAIMRQLRARDIVRTWGVITRWIATAGAIGALASTRKRKPEARTTGPHETIESCPTATLRLRLMSSGPSS
jgi:hypothetical protein